MAAAAVIAHHKHHRAQDGDGHGETPHNFEGSIDDIPELHGDNDGRVSVTEIKSAMKVLAVRADVLHARLKLEKDLTNMCMKLPLFLACMIFFITALMEFNPASSVSDIHAHINTHFELDTITSSPIKDVSDIYSYILKFEKANEKLQANSVKFWCERRYATHKWDMDYLMPKWTCKSPRQYALTLSTDPAWKWTAVHPSSPVPAPPPVVPAGAPACVDDDAALQAAEGDTSLTCASYHHICEVDLGMTLCPASCGFCAAWEYDQTAKFDKPQVTMLPVVIYQTRFALGDCHGFSKIYDKQPYNPVLWKLPTLDGKKHGKILRCVDRAKQFDETYSHTLKCPADTQSVYCENGERKIIHKHTFHGLTVYPMLLIEPHHDVHQLEMAQWLDGQTDQLTLSTMIYTEGDEIFTSLSVDFTFTPAGNIVPSYTVVSYRDMVEGSKTTFIVCLIFALLCSLIGVLLSARILYIDRRECQWGLVMYELVSRLAVGLFCFVLLLSWSQQVPMSEEYDHVLHTFLDLPGTSKDDLESAMQSYFDAKTHIYSETSWLKRMKVTAYLVLYMQFVQVIFYMSAHPKMGVLTATISKSAAHLIHFFLLFGIIFLNLAFVAHWMLGGHIQAFATFGSTVEAQSRMLFGEYIYADGAEHLTSGYTAMYWLYAGTYMLIIFFLLLNFFLAIIVDAFVEVKGGLEDPKMASVLNAFLADLWAVAGLNLHWRRRRWPPRSEIIKVLDNTLRPRVEKGWVKRLGSEDKLEEPDEEEAPAAAATMAVSQLMDSVHGFSEEKLAEFLQYYFGLSNSVLIRRKGCSLV